MAQDHFYSGINMHLNEIVEHVMERNNGTPSAGVVEARIFYENTTNKPMYYNGSSWQLLDRAILNEMTDVTINTAVNGNILQHDGTSWKNVMLSLGLSGLNNVEASAATDGQALVYEALNDRWVPGSQTGGLGIENAAVNRLVLSGASNAANLLAQAKLTWDGINFIAKGSGVVGTISTRVTSDSTEGTTIGHLGASGHQGPSVGEFINAGIRVVASEDHSASERGSVLMLMSTNVNESRIKAALVQTKYGGIVIGKDLAWNEGHEHADLFIKGSQAVQTVFISNSVSHYSLDSSLKNDYFILKEADGSSANYVTLPDPTDAYQGRTLEIKRKGEGANVIVATQTLIGHSEFFVGSDVGGATGLVDNIPLETNGDSVKLICALYSSGVWKWMLVGGYSVSYKNR